MFVCLSFFLLFYLFFLKKSKTRGFKVGISTIICLAPGYNDVSKAKNYCPSISDKNDSKARVRLYEEAL